jgi:ribosomal protein L7/L12
MADVDINALGDQIANLTLKQAKELSDYVKDKYGIEPAAGGGMMMAPAAEAGPAAAAVQTEFDVVLMAAGDKKLEVVKAVKAITGAAPRLNSSSSARPLLRVRKGWTEVVWQLGFSSSFCQK